MNKSHSLMIWLVQITITNHIR